MHFPLQQVFRVCEYERPFGGDSRYPPVSVDDTPRSDLDYVTGGHTTALGRSHDADTAPDSTGAACS